MNIKLKFDRLLAQGQGKQLLWLFVISLLCIGVALLITQFVFDDGTFVWQDVVSMFIDPGSFGGAGEHDLFRLVLVTIGLCLYSTIMISVFSNVFENIGESVRNGERRYNLHDFVLIIGNGTQLRFIIDKLAHKGKTIVVMSETTPNVEEKHIYYKGSRDSLEDLASAHPEKAQAIYVIGHDDEPNHDARSLKCMALLDTLCKDARKDIGCFLTTNSQLTTEVFQYLKQKRKSQFLHVDIINDHEYQAEQLLVNSPFLPVLKQGDKRQAHVIIIGTGQVAQAAAYTVAHICHYPNYVENGQRTRITFIGEDMDRWRNQLLASRPALFAMSHHTIEYPDGRSETHTPEALPHLGQGNADFLDVEWHFVDSAANAPLARRVMEQACTDRHATCIMVCHENTDLATETVLHLPRVAYRHAHIAVYMNKDTELLQHANATGMYGEIQFFGPASEANTDPLYDRRSERGQRVNYIYRKHYKREDETLGSPEAEWHHLSEADKYSSIYCANAMFLRQACYPMSQADDDLMLPIYEAEHRRWMMSELLMGFAPGAQTDKKKFVHADIVPFGLLTQEDQRKDKLLIDHTTYVTTGKQNT